jgi:hypothetical protein
MIVVISFAWSGCATSSSTQASEGSAASNESERPADCVITDPQGDEVQIQQCYVETGPEGAAESVRIPIVETTTKTSAGEFTYPLKFELEVTDRGKIRIIGPVRRSQDTGDEEGSVPAETPSMEEIVEEGDEEDEQGDEGGEGDMEGEKGESSESGEPGEQ